MSQKHTSNILPSASVGNSIPNFFKSGRGLPLRSASLDGSGRAHQYGSVEAPSELVELVDAYAKLDGSMDRTSKAMELMARFCRENRKAN